MTSRRKTWALRRARTTDDAGSQAVRTRAATQQAADGWIWPHWLERQLDPTSPAFVPSGPLPGLTNVTQRNWTTVGTVASDAKGIVDPRGLVTPWPGGWSLDWWIGAEDRWHFPSRETAVRQGLVAESPVVETAMRIPGGDAIQRVYAIPGAMAVVEITNATPTPIAVGFAVRPYNPEGVAGIERIGLDDTTVTVDGRPALLLPRRPQRMASSTFADGDAARLVTAEELATELPDGLRCDAGLATATFVFPLAHRQTLRVVLPLRDELATDLPAPLPDSEAVARSWQAQTANRGMRLVLPEGRLASAVEANRRFLLLFHEGTDVAPRGDAVAVLAALDRYGFHAESAEVLEAYAAQQRGDATAVFALAEHRRLTESTDGADAASIALDTAASEAIRDESCVGPAVFDRAGLTGLSAARTLQLAGVELRAGDRRALDRLAWVLEAATPTFTWPEAIHPGLGGGCAGDGHHAQAAADFLSFVRDLLVREVGDDELALCSMLPADWTGQPLEVHDAPTHHGVVSFAIRWHGDRPALLWDRRPHAGAGSAVIRLTAPGIDPAWSTTEPKGEALLAAPVTSFA